MNSSQYYDIVKSCQIGTRCWTTFESASANLHPAADRELKMIWYWFIDTSPSPVEFSRISIFYNAFLMYLTRLIEPSRTAPRRKRISPVGGTCWTAECENVTAKEEKRRNPMEEPRRRRKLKFPKQVRGKVCGWKRGPSSKYWHVRFFQALKHLPLRFSTEGLITESWARAGWPWTLGHPLRWEHNTGKIF